MRPLSFCVACLCALVFAPQANADTAFGGDPSQAVTPGLSCSFGAPLEILGSFGAYPGTPGSQSCMWGWSNPSVGTDIVPIPATGGRGTVTSVTLPAMPNPGPMEVVVLTAALNASTNPAKPDYICCQVKQVGPTFTVPANQVTTVAQNLGVSATEGADLSRPGDTSFGDLLGISVKSPTASLPVRYTGNVSLNNFDGAYAYYPAPGGARGEFLPPYNVTGFQMLARFNFSPAGAGPSPAGGGGGQAGVSGLRLLGTPVRVGRDGRTVILGQATNPPIVRTTQTLTAPTGARAASSAAKKPVVFGRGQVKVPAGSSRGIKLALNGKGRARLAKRGQLKATLTVVAKTAQGEAQRRTRTVTIKPKPPKR